MVGMKHWPFQYTTHFIPQLKILVVTSRRKRFVKLSQQQQTRFGYLWHRTKFITVWGMDLNPLKGFRPLHWFVPHRHTLLHTSPVQKRQWFLCKLCCQMMATLNRMCDDFSAHTCWFLIPEDITLRMKFSTPCVYKFYQLVITYSFQSIF
jgi:hypothetical protein